VNDAAANVSGSLDNLGDAIRGQADRVGERAVDEAANQTSRAANDLADQIRRHGDRAVGDVGAALQGAGASLRDRPREPVERDGYERADGRDRGEDRR
jgi:ABC-type transporter Mla subunit MlaD